MYIYIYIYIIYVYIYIYVKRPSVRSYCPFWHSQSQAGDNNIGEHWLLFLALVMEWLKGSVYVH